MVDCDKSAASMSPSGNIVFSMKLEEHTLLGSNGNVDIIFNDKECFARTGIVFRNYVGEVRGKHLEDIKKECLIKGERFGFVREVILDEVRIFIYANEETMRYIMVSFFKDGFVAVDKRSIDGHKGGVGIKKAIENLTTSHILSYANHYREVAEHRIETFREDND